MHIRNFSNFKFVNFYKTEDASSVRTTHGPQSSTCTLLILLYFKWSAVKGQMKDICLRSEYVCI